MILCSLPLSVAGCRLPPCSWPEFALSALRTSSNKCSEPRGAELWVSLSLHVLRGASLIGFPPEAGLPEARSRQSLDWIPEKRAVEEGRQQART